MPKRAGWYVIQVQTGHERKVCQALERACAHLTCGPEYGEKAPASSVAPKSNKVQTPAAEQDVAVGGIDLTLPAQPLLQECFSPRYTTQRKHDGTWQWVEKPLLPGYVVAVTEQPDKLGRALREIPEFARLLTAGETFVPLRDDERAWMEEFTKAGERSIPMSFGHREGERLVVTSGPLKGREGMVTRINRRKSLAYVELHINGKKVTTTVGLAVVPEEQGPPRPTSLYK